MKRLLLGPHAVAEALHARPGDVELVCISDSLQPTATRRIDDLAKQSRVPCEVMPKAALDALAGELHHQGIIAITGVYPYLDLPTLLEHTEKVERPLLVLLDQIQDPRNLGAILRSVHAFGAIGVILPKDRAAEITAAAVRTSAGASELLHVARVTNIARTLEQLGEQGFRSFGAVMGTGRPLSEVEFGARTVLVLGNEGKGLRRLTVERCDELFHIPMATAFDSLNVSAAAAIALYAASVSRHRTG